MSVCHHQTTIDFLKSIHRQSDHSKMLVDKIKVKNIRQIAIVPFLSNFLQTSSQAKETPIAWQIF